MAIIVEDGTGLEDAVSYASVDYALAYHAARGNTAWAALATEAQESNLIKATDYLVAQYRTRWKGARSFPIVQALDWPRTGVVIEGVTLSSTSIPKEIKNACVELALRASMGPLIDDSASGGSAGGAVIQETVGPITVKYAAPTEATTKTTTTYSLIELMLAAFLGSSSSVMTKLTRV